MDETTRLGPLISQRQKDRVLDFIRKGIESGAELVAGGPDEHPGTGYFVQPTIFGRVEPSATIAQEEIFGPVLSIICYRDEAEALKIADGTDYALADAVWSADEAHAHAFAAKFEAGQIDVNGALFNLNAPFGGLPIIEWVTAIRASGASDVRALRARTSMQLAKGASPLSNPGRHGDGNGTARQREEAEDSVRAGADDSGRLPPADARSRTGGNEPR